MGEGGRSFSETLRQDVTGENSVDILVIFSISNLFLLVLVKLFSAVIGSREEIC
jgi:hypothetical protein